MASERARSGLYPFNGYFPQVAENVFIAPGARIVGRVEIAPLSSIWYNTVVRGDIDIVRIGTGTNIQDGSVLHEDAGYPLLIGDWVTVGHNVVLHGCTIGNGAFIGMGAVVLSGAVIEPGAVVGAGALVLQGQKIPAGSLALGSPAKVIKTLGEDEIKQFQAAADKYSKRAMMCLEAEHWSER